MVIWLFCLISTRSARIDVLRVNRGSEGEAVGCFKFCIS